MRSILLCLMVVVLAASEPIPVVTGNSIVHDLALRIGGERFAVSCLAKPGVDPHAYQPVPDDVRRLAAAKLVIINGLGFEGWFENLAAEARFAGTVVVASAGITTLTMHDAHDHGAHEHGTAAVVADPHAYNSIRQGVRYAENIRDALMLADPAAASDIRARANELIGALRRTDAWATAKLAALPKAQRTIITNHNALAYFARDYGFEVLAPNTALEDSQPSAKELAGLVSFIQQHGVKGVFLEYGKNPKLIDQLAAEARVKVGAALYLDGVGQADSPAASYDGMFRCNVEAICAALQ